MHIYVYVLCPHAVCIVDSWRATPALTLETTRNECTDNNSGFIHDVETSLNLPWPSDTIWSDAIWHQGPW